MKIIFALLMILTLAPKAEAHLLLRNLLGKIAAQPTLPDGCTLSYDEQTEIVKIKNEQNKTHEFKVANLEKEIQLLNGKNDETWLCGNYSNDEDLMRSICIGLTSESQLVAFRVVDQSVAQQGPTFFEASCRD